MFTTSSVNIIKHLYCTHTSYPVFWKEKKRPTLDLYVILDDGRYDGQTLQSQLQLIVYYWRELHEKRILPKQHNHFWQAGTFFKQRVPLWTDAFFPKNSKWNILCIIIIIIDDKEETN